jgi:hypothetical protein
MVINVMIQLFEGDQPMEKSGEMLAAQILNVLGGDPEKDVCNVSVSAAPPITASIGPPLDATGQPIPEAPPPAESKPA